MLQSTDVSILSFQVLQKFHRAKPHKGSPLKASQLSSIRGKTRPYMYDPRPLKRRNPEKNEEKLRNVILNSQVRVNKITNRMYGNMNVMVCATNL